MNRLLEGKLQKMGDGVRQSKYALADASILFIPIVKTINGQKVNDVDINIIDLSQGISYDEVKDDPEALQTFQTMQKDLAICFDELALNARLIVDKRMNNSKK